MKHQTDQLKEEINGKAAALVKEHLEFQRVEKEKEALKVHCHFLIPSVSSALPIKSPLRVYCILLNFFFCSVAFQLHMKNSVF